MTDLHKVVKVIIKNEGITGRELALLWNVSVINVSDTVRGKVDINQRKLKSILDAYGYTMIIVKKPVRR